MAKATIMDLWMWPLAVAETATGAVKTMMGAQTVIAQRLPLIATAFINPFAADWPELARMVPEKVDAFGKAGRAHAAGHRTLQSAITAQTRDAARLASGDWFGPLDWWQMANRSLQFWSTAVSMPGEMLSPVRKQVASNVRRLS